MKQVCEHVQVRWNKCQKPKMKLPWSGLEHASNLKIQGAKTKRGRFGQCPRRMHACWTRESAGKAWESAGKAVASAMKVADKSAGNFQPARTHEDLHDLHARFFQKKWNVPET
jgi:hypothetical protein